MCTGSSQSGRISQVLAEGRGRFAHSARMLLAAVESLPLSDCLFKNLRKQISLRLPFHVDFNVKGPIWLLRQNVVQVAVLRQHWCLDVNWLSSICGARPITYCRYWHIAVLSEYILTESLDKDRPPFYTHKFSFNAFVLVMGVPSSGKLQYHM